MAMFFGIFASCNQKLEFEDLSPAEADSISIVNSNRELDSLPQLRDSSKALANGSIGDEWKTYFTQCLKSDIDSKISYVTSANTKGPGNLVDTKLGLPGKDLKSILPANVYMSLIDSSSNTPVCQLSENDYKLIGGSFKINLLNMIHINPDAEGSKLDTVTFNLTSYKRLALNKGVLDSLYNARSSDPKLQSYFDEFSQKQVSLIIKGYVISGFNASIKFKKLDTVGLDAGLDSGLVKNFSGTIGFKFKKENQKTITASSTADFIPLVQFVRLKDLRKQ